MLRQPKISIIIPIYNAERHIGQCLDSVVNQTYKNLEIICINDGSTDDTASILNEYKEKDKRIILINQNNMGNSISRNIGLNKVTGKYLFFVDADDYLMLNIIEKLYNTIIKTKANFVISATKVIFESDNQSLVHRRDKLINYFSKLPSEDIIKVNADNYINCYSNIPNVVWGKLYDTKYVKKHKLNFYNGRTVHDDVAYTLKLMSTFPKFSVIRDVGVFYRVEEGSISEINNRSQYKNKKVNDMSVSIINAKNYIKQKLKKEDSIKIINLINKYYKKYIDTDIYKKLEAKVSKENKSKFVYKTISNNHITYSILGIRFKFKIKQPV